MNKQLKLYFTYFIIILSVFGLTIRSVYSREIRDMSGRKVTIPEKITRVYSSSPTATYMIYAIDPDLLVGLNFPISEREKAYLKKNFLSLPVIGGFFGQGRTPNIEMIIKADPDIIVTWSWKVSAFDRKSADSLERLQLPLIITSVDSLSGYPGAFIFFGKLLNREKRASELARYTAEVLSEAERLIASVPDDKKPKVYYAEGRDGLYTECEGSLHCELIPMAGGKNVNKCIQKTRYGMERISIEQVMLLNPDIILTSESIFYSGIYNDPKWKSIKAVKTGRIYLIPVKPFNWFDRPPSFMRILGLQWALKSFYPEKYKKDIIKETKTFFKLFLDINITNAEIQEILNIGK